MSRSAPRTCSLRLAAILGATWLVCFETAPAQTARSGSATSQMQAQFQQLAAEKTRLQADNEKLKKDLDDVRKDLDALKNERKALDERSKGTAAALAQNKKDRESLTDQLKQGKDRTAELVVKFRETAQSLRDTEIERAKLQQTLTLRDQEIHTCTDHNVSLYRLNDELTSKLEHEGVWSRTAASEPFTRLKRIENENLADEYRAKAAEQLSPRAPSDATPAKSP